MAQICHEPAHMCHIIITAPPNKLWVCPLGTDKAHDSGTLHLVPYFQWPLLQKKTEQKRNVETPYWRRDGVLSQILSTCSTAHLGDSGHVMYSLSAYRDILLWLLLRPGLGKKQGSAHRWVNQIKEGQGADWAEMVFFLWNHSSGVQTSAARLQCGKEPVCMRKLQSVNCYRKPMETGSLRKSGEVMCFYNKTASLAFVVLTSCVLETW